jgi:hypothetical protein
MFTLVAGCVNSNLSTPAIGSTPTQRLTSLPLKNPTETITPAPLSSAILVTDTPMLVKAEHCLNVGEQEVKLQDVSTGTVLLGRLKRPLYLLELKSQTRYEIPVQMDADNYHFYGIHTSINKEYLAYIDGYVNGEKWEKLNIWVVDAKGSLIASKPIGLDILNNGWRWLDNERIQILFGKAAQDGTVYIYSPFVQKGEDVANNFPNFYKDYSFRESNWLVEYNSDMNWVVYLGYMGDVGIGPIFWDITAQKKIWQGSGFLATINQPVWSPTDNQIALVFEKRLHIVNRDGSVKSPPIFNENDEVTRFEWSPNGRYISFWVVRNRDIKANIMLYDTQTDQIVDYCVASFARSKFIVWSPDSSQFVTGVEAEKADLSLDEFSLLVDIEKNVGYRISKEMQPIEWMNSAP